MASIDRIYATKKQYDEFHLWCKLNRPSLLRYMLSSRDKYWDNYEKNEERAISSFPMRTDMWLLKNCPFKWVIKRIKEQYKLK